MHPAKAIANFFLDKARDSGQLMTQMKLQKLVYYAYGWYLGITGNILIDEQVEAWQFGPVFPSLYHEFKSFGARPIIYPATDFDTTNYEMSEPRIPVDAVRDAGILAQVWRVYGKFSAERLSAMTHEPDSPWTLTWNEAGGRKGVDIPIDSIRSYFLRKVEQNRDAQQRRAAEPAAF